MSNSVSSTYPVPGIVPGRTMKVLWKTGNRMCLLRWLYPLVALRNKCLKKVPITQATDETGVDSRKVQY